MDERNTFCNFVPFYWGIKKWITPNIVLLAILYVIQEITERFSSPQWKSRKNWSTHSIFRKYFVPQWISDFTHPTPWDAWHPLEHRDRGVFIWSIKSIVAVLKSRLILPGHWSASSNLSQSFKWPPGYLWRRLGPLVTVFLYSPSPKIFTLSTKNALNTTPRPNTNCNPILYDKPFLNKLILSNLCLL